VLGYVTQIWKCRSRGYEWQAQLEVAIPTWQWPRPGHRKVKPRHPGLNRSAYLTSRPRIPFTTSSPHNQSLPNHQRKHSPQASYLNQCPATPVYNTKRSLFLGLVARTSRFSVLVAQFTARWVRIPRVNTKRFLYLSGYYGRFSAIAQSPYTGFKFGIPGIWKSRSCSLRKTRSGWGILSFCAFRGSYNQMRVVHFLPV
jgi:hypothetical protein